MQHESYRVSCFGAYKLHGAAAIGGFGHPCDVQTHRQGVTGGEPWPLYQGTKHATCRENIYSISGFRSPAHRPSASLLNTEQRELNH